MQSSSNQEKIMDNIDAIIMLIFALSLGGLYYRITTLEKKLRARQNTLMDEILVGKGQVLVNSKTIEEMLNVISIQSEATHTQHSAILHIDNTLCGAWEDYPSLFGVPIMDKPELKVVPIRPHTENDGE
jgi:hypothetical protein